MRKTGLSACISSRGESSCTTPREGVVEEGMELTQHFFSQVAMQRVAVAAEIRKGWSDYVNTKFFKDAEETEALQSQEGP